MTKNTGDGPVATVHRASCKAYSLLGQRSEKTSETDSILRLSEHHATHGPTDDRLTRLLHRHPLNHSTSATDPSGLHGLSRERCATAKGKDSPYSITELRVPELIPVLGSQPTGDVSHKPGGRLPLLSARPAVTLATIKRAATNFAAC